jgi:hypothetical protein
MLDVCQKNSGRVGVDFAEPSYAFRSVQWFLAEDELILPAVERLSLQKCFLVETVQCGK